ncbi:MAG: hypothetical protein A2W33_03905 [Chloroflexi bacterium RBG_16_52_11]|nr:MAG: hypothetical protein A2W33_03905 [Chloroflexi bacterium RBG_16_52_11]
MKKLRWPILIVLIALVAIALLLRTQQSPILQPVPLPVEPAAGGIYTEALIGSLGRLNPLLDYYNPADRDIDRLLYSGLIRFDDRGIPLADLAESWGISQDGTIYNFAIRPNAVWHDGEPVTSEDVLFTVEKMRDETFPLPTDLREFWKQVEVKVLDEKNLQFVLPEAFSPFLDYLTFGVLPQHILGGVSPAEIINAEFNLKPVGSGPYQFDRFQIEDGQIIGVVLSAFADYHLNPPFIDQLVMRYYPDAAAGLAAYREGEVQGISYISPEILPDALKQSELRLYTGRQPRLTLVYLNLDDAKLPFFQDETIRRALLMALNRQWMMDRLLGGQSLIADGPIFPGTWAYFEGIERIDYDSAAALEIIKSAGYSLPTEGSNVREKDGVRFAFEMLYPDTAEHAKIAEAIQQDWAKLGVDVTIKAVPYEELVNSYLEPRSYQAALVDLNLARYPDPDPYPFWDQAQITGGQNYAQWNDRQASEYLEQARIIPDLAERAKAYRNFQVRFTNQMPALPLFFPVYSYAVDQSVQGVRMGPLFDTSDRFATILDWFLLAKRSTNLESTPTATP